jgi:hypothetical protein
MTHTYIPREAALALEWFHASGDRTVARLYSLVDHFCTTNGIDGHDVRAAIYKIALDHARLTNNN